MMDIKELLKKAYWKGIENRNASSKCEKVEFATFESWYNAEDIKQEVKNIDALDSVSNQRKLLTSFYDDLKSKVGEYRIRTISTKKAVESFIKNNQ